MDDRVLAAFRRASGDRERGAGAIERELVATLLELRPRWQAASLQAGAAELTAGQPVMANLRSLARRFEAGDPHAASRWLEGRAAVLAELPARLAAHAQPLFDGCRRVLSISRSSAVAAVVEGAAARGWRGQVVVFDGSAAGGGREQAAALAAAGLDVVSRPDAVMRSELEQGAGATLVVVGADAVSERRLVNAIGTGALLELAAARAVARVVVADSGKDLPDRELDRLLAAATSAEEPGPGRRWPVFELLPRSLVEHRISESGIESTPQH